MGGENSKVSRADRAVKTTEAWWAFLEQLWGARWVVGPMFAASAVITAAFYNVFAWINKFGWAGWVLAAIPATLLAAFIFWALHWVFHHIQLRKIRRRRADQGLGDPIDVPQEIDRAAIKQVMLEELHTIPRAASEAELRHQAKVNLLARYVLGKETNDLRVSLRAVIDDHLGKLEAHKLMKGKRDPNFYITIRRSLDRSVFHRLGAFGFDMQKLTHKLREAENRIKIDADYLIVHEHEKELWLSGHEKRTYHIENARLMALKSFIDDVDTYPVQPDELIAGLRNP